MSRAANGMSMRPIGKILATLHLGATKHKEDLHISMYQEVSWVLLSWTVSKALGILPECYPTPVKVTSNTTDNVPCNNSQQLNNDTHVSGHDGWVPIILRWAYQDNGGWALPHLIIWECQAIPCEYTFNNPVHILWQAGLTTSALLNQSQNQQHCVPQSLSPPHVKKTAARSGCVLTCLDRLNRYVRRERYQSLIPAQAVADIVTDRAKVFTMIDARKGYRQRPLDPESQLLTTFITPFRSFSVHHKEYHSFQSITIAKGMRPLRNSLVIDVLLMMLSYMTVM